MPPANCTPPEVEFLGYSDALDEQRYEGEQVGGLSGLAYDPERNLYYVIADGGLENAPARFYTLRISLERGRLTDPVILDATTLRDPQGKPFTGANFDGEAIVLTREDQLLIASETEPSIRRFSLEGKFLAKLPVPRRFLVAPKGYALDNYTFEGLAQSSSGRTLLTATERGLSTDKAKRFPINLWERVLGHGRERVRLLRYNAQGASSFFEPSEEFYYRTQWGAELSGIVALSERELLAVEKSSGPIFQISLEGAEDVSDEKNLAASNATPLERELLVDVADCPLSSSNKDSSGFLEGMALGPALPDGRQTLLMVSDDNYITNEKTRMIALGIRLR